MIDYCNGVKCFINYTLSNLRNSSRGGIRYPCKTCKNKKVSRSEYCNDASSIKIVNEKKYLCWFVHEEPYVPYETLV